MVRDFVYFDLETQRTANDVGGWDKKRDIGISLGVTYSTKLGEYRIYTEKELDALVNQLLRADLVIGRAGATTVAELAIAGKPAIFIPYPFAADNHQEINAREMATAGAALSFKQSELTADKLADALRPLFDDATKRSTMGAAMKSLAKPRAAAAVVDWCAEQT